MNDHRFLFHGADLRARPSGALWWPDRALLAVADLHLGKACRMARRGGAALPPYESADTLARLEAEIRATAPACVISLGDSFDDTAAAALLDADLRARLSRLADACDWVWVHGNHDPDRLPLPGRQVAAMQIDGLAFTHIATAASGEVSGHYHPKARLRLRGGAVTRRCFLIDAARVILPAFGTYTGGLDTTAPELCRLMADDAQAVLLGETALAVPMPRRKSVARRRFA